MLDPRRRQFLTLLGGAAIAWPLVARAQQSRPPVIGFLLGGSAEARAPMVAAFRQGLAEAGYVEGQNVAIEFQWGEARSDPLPALAAELVRRQVAVLVAAGGDAPGKAAKGATSSISIVFAQGGRRGQRWLVKSLDRPLSHGTRLC